mmetsp:Transcript_12880/g.25168  ORF Transcript_12880/g.25168 Transcript_12880/m.25168 type:complete len:201 (-) Transcript_12880:881-1483(-)
MTVLCRSAVDLNSASEWAYLHSAAEREHFPFFSIGHIEVLKWRLCVGPERHPARGVMPSGWENGHLLPRLHFPTVQNLQTCNLSPPSPPFSLCSSASSPSFPNVPEGSSRSLTSSFSVRIEHRGVNAHRAWTHLSGLQSVSVRHPHPGLLKSSGTQAREGSLKQFRLNGTSFARGLTAGVEADVLRFDRKREETALRGRL